MPNISSHISYTYIYIISHKIRLFYWNNLKLVKTVSVWRNTFLMILFFVPIIRMKRPSWGLSVNWLRAVWQTPVLTTPSVELCLFVISCLTMLYLPCLTTATSLFVKQVVKCSKLENPSLLVPLVVSLLSSWIRSYMTNAGHYAGSYYYQSHMVWWTHGPIFIEPCNFTRNYAAYWSQWIVMQLTVGFMRTI